MSKINEMNNEDKYTHMIELLGEGAVVKLADFLLPWTQYQRSDNITKEYDSHELYIPRGKYFEFLRWLIFKMIKENKYINDITSNLLTFFENGVDLTGIFRINTGGDLYKLLTNCDLNKIFHYTDTIVTISNTQLSQYITECKEIQKSIKKVVTKKSKKVKNNIKRKTHKRKCVKK